MSAYDPHNHEFLAPRSRYYGRSSPAHLAFNAHLQAFTCRVNTLCNLETGGKITPDDAYEEIKTLWQQLSDSYEALGLPGQSDG